MSNSLNSLRGSLPLLATPSLNRKKTAMIFSAILTKHSGHTTPSKIFPRTWLHSFLSDTSTVLTASVKCWIQRVIAVSKFSHSMSSISSGLYVRRYSGFSRISALAALLYLTCHT